MRKVVLFILSVTFILASSLVAAQTWNLDYGNYTIAWADVTNNVEVNNDSIYVLYSDQNPNVGRRLNIMNLNIDNGDVIWNKVYAKDSVGMNGGAWNSADGPTSSGKFVLAQHFETSTEESNDVDLGQLVVFNQYWDTLTTTLKGDSIDRYIYHQAKVLSDDNFIATGWTNASLSGLSNTLLVKYDENGEELWTTVHSAINNYRNQVFSVTELGNGNIVTGGFTGVTSNVTDFQILTMFDSEGNYLDHRLFGDEEWTALGWARLDPTSDGNLIMTSSMESENGDNYYYVSKIDTNLNSIWEKYHYSGTPDASLRQVKETEDGGYIGVGIWIDPPTAYRYGFFIKFDEEGEVLWERRYQHADEGNFQWNHLYDVAEVPNNGGYVACGERNETDTGQNAWVIKVDSMGCLIPGCDTLTSVTEIEHLDQLDVLVYPNPASEQAFVKVPDLSFSDQIGSQFFLKLYDLQGKLIRSTSVGRFEATYILDINGIQSGMYSLTLENEKGVPLVTKKMVVE